MNNAELAEIMFPGVDKTPEDYELIYPPRKLAEGAQVTRFAPSPTGFIHLGNLYGAMADERIAHCSGGIVYLRIEDTDLKRQVRGAVESVISTLGYFGVKFDEGEQIEGENAYGPYRQRQRAAIYRSCAKRLVEKGLAYPCFCTEEDLAGIRARQAELKQDPGYYGEWTRCRGLSCEEAAGRIAAGVPYSVRLRSQGRPGATVKFRDQLLGEITLPQNRQDAVILKSDGIPTYHFAHAVDDHYMRTTTVVRGVEWLSSAPLHIELFGALGFRMPKYVHTALLMKLDNGKKRKLSKRKDPELGLEYYKKCGYHPEAVRLYMMTVLNSDFEEWRLANPGAGIEKFRFSAKKMGVSGALFDLKKLDDISAGVFSGLSSREALDFYLEWAREYSPKAYEEAAGSGEKLLEVFSLCMGEGQKRRRKDFVSAGQISGLIEYFRAGFEPDLSALPDHPDGAGILTDFAALYDPADTQEEWFGKLRRVAAEHGYAAEMSAYKKEPEKYAGSIADASQILRAAVTGRTSTPDLCAVMRIIGREESLRRIRAAAGYLKK